MFTDTFTKLFTGTFSKFTGKKINTVVRHGLARLGKAWHVTAQDGTVRHGTARHGTSWHGTAWYGMAGYGTA